MMREAGLDIVRIAEFAWSKMEPENGRFSWLWLDEAMEVLAGAGLQIVLGTPTATPPIWLTQTYPEILRVDANGRSRNHGTRRHYCPNSPTYREFTIRIVDEMVKRYGNHPALIGWQIDNEFGGGKTGRCYCKQCEIAFQKWLQHKYGSIDALNEAWGAIFWSQTYSEWGQIPLPDGRIDKASPSHELDYFRFASDSIVAYQQVQIERIKQYSVLSTQYAVNSEQWAVNSHNSEFTIHHSQFSPPFITHNFMGLYRDLDQFELAKELDFITWDNYPTGFTERWRGFLQPVGGEKAVHAYDVGDPLMMGMAHALMYGLKQAPFWIMEQQCGHINWGETNQGIRPGTTRLWTWHALACGADVVVYFRWRATQFAHEQYHSGLLRHDGETAVGYHDLLKMQEIRDWEILQSPISNLQSPISERTLMAHIAAQPLTAEVAILCSYDDLWAIQLQPHRRDFDYWRLTFVYYQVLQQLGIPVHMVPKTADFSPYKLLIAPTAHLVDETLAQKLTEYAQNGGTLLLGVRSGFKTPSNLVTDQPLPGLLRPLVGATVADWQSLPDGVSWELETAVPGLSGPVGYWVEQLRAETAVARGEYSVNSTQYSVGSGASPISNLQSPSAAITENVVGNGRVYYLGFYPTPAQATAWLRYLAGQQMISRLAELPPGLVAARRGAFVMLLNFTDTPLTAGLPQRSIMVQPRDVVVWVEGS